MPLYRKYSLFIVQALLLQAPLSVSMASDLVLNYDKPVAENKYINQGLPIGNGRIGAVLYGGLADERVVFNEITLWAGDEEQKGAYQPFGEVTISTSGHDQHASEYRRELDLDSAEH